MYNAKNKMLRIMTVTKIKYVDIIDNVILLYAKIKRCNALYLMCGYMY